MNCEACRRRLLRAPEPAVPPANVAAHLAQCLACRDWQEQLLRVEHNVGRLPAPPSAPEGFIEKLLQARPAEISAPPRTLPFPGPARWSAKRWVATVAGGLAAAAILITAGILLGNLLSGALKKDDNIAKNIEKPSPSVDEVKPSPSDGVKPSPDPKPPSPPVEP